MDPVLYTAVEEGNIDILNQQTAGDLEAQLTPANNTILHLAALLGHTELVNHILEKCGKSLLCSVNALGETALHISVREGHDGIVGALIQYAKTLDVDVESGNSVKEMLRMKNAEGDTALFEAVRNEELDAVEMLTKEDPDFPHFPNNDVETPLYLAAERNSESIVSKILENCISPAYIGPNGRTALHAVIICHHPECVRMLYEWKPSLIKEEDAYGWRPLHTAALLGNVEAVRQLLGLDKTVAYLVTENDDNMAAIHIAASQGHIEVVKEVLSHCPDCWDMINSRGQNILHIAGAYGEGNMMKFILEKSFCASLLNKKDIDGNTPAHLVATLPFSLKYSLVLLAHPRMDSLAANKKNLNVLEILQKDVDPREVAMAGHRNKFILRKNIRGKILSDITKYADTQLIVTTLIATVTFAAGFTVPGGYDGNEGPNQGMAVLARRAAFMVFVVTDTIAMISSIIAVCLLLFASAYTDEGKRNHRIGYALYLTFAAMGAMVVAFMTGLYVVLAHTSLGLAITICVICCSFFLIFGYVFKKWVADIFS